MKVLHMITGLGSGGAELQLRSLLQRTRHEADVVTLYNPGPVAEMIESDGNRVRDIGMRSNTELSALPRLRRLIRDGGYDVVHTHLYRSCIYGRPAARLAGTPVVVTTEHSIGETHIERRPMSPGVRALYLATDVFSTMTIAVSAVTRDRLMKWGIPDRKITVIPNGLDFTRVAFDAAARGRIRSEFGVDPGTYLIGVLGRLDPNKRFDLVIEAAAPLLGERTKLLVIGGGEERARLEATARRLGVAAEVVFAGERHDVGPMLSALDLFVASSVQETFGLSTLEALENGLPALYTTCPALDGISSDRARQVPGDAAAIRGEISVELAAGPRPRESLAPVREMYSMDAVAQRIDDLYDLLLAKSGRRAGPRRLAADGRHAAGG